MENPLTTEQEAAAVAMLLPKMEQMAQRIIELESENARLLDRLAIAEAPEHNPTPPQRGDIMFLSNTGEPAVPVPDFYAYEDPDFPRWKVTDWDGRKVPLLGNAVRVFRGRTMGTKHLVIIKTPRGPYQSSSPDNGGPVREFRLTHKEAAAFTRGENERFGFKDHGNWFVVNKFVAKKIVVAGIEIEDALAKQKGS